MANIDTLRVEVVGASEVVPPAVTQNGDPASGGNSRVSNMIVYGGITGASCGSSSENCNNCGNQNLPCNVRRINPEAYLIFKFRSDKAEAFSGSPTLFFINTANTSAKIIPDYKSTYLAPNVVLEIGIKWKNLCAALSGNVNLTCSSAVSGEIQVGVSANSDATLDDFFTAQVVVMGVPSDDTTNYDSIKFATPNCNLPSTTIKTYEGFCYLTIQRGDEKVYIDNEIHGPNYNSVSADENAKFKALRIYYAEGPINGDDTTFASTVNSSSAYKDFTFTLSDSTTSSGKVATLDDRKITGLKNGVRYYFQFANVDSAGNVFYFSANNTLKYDLHSSKPEEVTGILDESQCFIATAAYGSKWAPQLSILRSFRNQFLMTNKLGRWFVTQYYKYSPEWAAKIKRKEESKAAVRAVLNPVVAAAQWMILYGLQSFILISSVGFLIGFFIVRRFIQNHD